MVLASSIRSRLSMANRPRTPSPQSRSSQHSLPATKGDGPLRVARGIVKALALIIGGCLTFLALMATTGLVVESGWIRSIVAALVMLVVPAVVVDRLLPESVDLKAKGLPTDVFSLVWLSIALVYTVPLYALTRPALTTEAERLSEAGYDRLARLAYFVAGTKPSATMATPAPKAATPPEQEPRQTAKPSMPPLPSASVTPSEAGPAASGSAPQFDQELPSKDAATLFEELAPAVVTVSVGQGEGVQGGGTGFLIDRHGTIATNHHVIREATDVRVTFMDGAIFKRPELLTEDATVDLALLRVALDRPDEGRPVEVKALRLGDSDAVIVGERALSIGNPLGLDHTLTDGLISARRTYEGRQWIQTSVPISPGNSGGPLFNFKGEVIGVTTASVGGMFGLAQNLNLAVPVNVLKRLVSNEYPAKRKFGEGQRSTHW
jgi:serine protease Do